MLKKERLSDIRDYIIENDSVTLDDLVDKYNVSKNTIRGDVQELVQGGRFQKVYGGVSINTSPPIPFHDRQVQNHLQKRHIGQLAAAYVEDGDNIFIDSGTTTLEMLDFLKHKNITVITNSIDFLIGALPYKGLSTITTGGSLNRKTKSLVSVDNKKQIKSFNINKAFLASTGVSLKNGVTNSFSIESEIKRSVVNRSEEVFLLVDLHKFGRCSLTTYCELNEIDYLVTDKLPPKEYVRYAEENHLKLIF